MTLHSDSIQQPTLPPPVMVATPEYLAYFRETIQSNTRLAVDTESNSLYTYREQVCLIQVSTDQIDFLVDPLRLRTKTELDFFGEVLADPGVEKVLHAAEYDVMVLKRDFGFTLANIFDTMIATRILGWKHIGLGAVLGERFGVEVNKSNQRANWGQRPLPPNLIQYAQIDTHFLLPLRDELDKELEKAGHLEEARELFAEVCTAQWNGGHFDPDDFWHLSGARSLEPAALAILRELYLYREEQARQRDLPVFKVMTDDVLLTLAAAAPRSLDAMRQRRLSERHIQRYGDGILRCVQRGLRASPPVPPRKNNNNHSSDLALKRFEALHTWRKDRAAQRGVPSDVVMPKDSLWELAEVAPSTREQLATIRSLGPWRIETYGDEILDVLSMVDKDTAAG
jgi:ribonuclease D